MKIENITCKCGYHAKLKKWRPPKGIDQRIRAFHCPNCGCDTYLRLPESQMKAIDEAIAVMEEGKGEWAENQA